MKRLCALSGLFLISTVTAISMDMTKVLTGSDLLPMAVGAVIVAALWIVIKELIASIL